MSEQVEQPQEDTSQVPAIPKEVTDLQNSVVDLGSFRTCVSYATFPGSQLETANKLRLHLNEVYKQLLDQFNNHPYVVKVRADATAKEAANGKA